MLFQHTRRTLWTIGVRQSRIGAAAPALRAGRLTRSVIPTEESSPSSAHNILGLVFYRNILENQLGMWKFVPNLFYYVPCCVHFVLRLVLHICIITLTDTNRSYLTHIPDAELESMIINIKSVNYE